MTSVRDAMESDVAQLASKHWSGAASKYDPALVQHVYERFLLNGGQRRVRGVSARQALDYSGYLEQYLWPHFTIGVSFEHVASIAMMVNEKGRESVSMWTVFEGSSSTDAEAERRFGALFLRVLLLRMERQLRPAEVDAALQFIIHAFQSLECDLVRKPCLRLVSLPLWLSVSPTRVGLEVAEGSTASGLRGAWERAQKAHTTLLASVSASPALAPLLEAHKAPAEADAPAASEPGVPALLPSGFFEALAAAAAAPADVSSASPATQPVALLQRLVDASFIPALLRQFISVLQQAGADASPPGGDHSGTGGKLTAALAFLTRCLELWVDLLSQLPTRRFTRLLLADAQLVVLCKRSPLYSVAKSTDAGDVAGAVAVAAAAGTASPLLFSQLTDALDFYVNFSVDEHSGQALGEAALVAATYNRARALQWLAYKHFAGASRDMKELALSATGRLAEGGVLRAYLECLSDAQLTALGRRLRLIPLPDFLAQQQQQQHGGGVEAAAAQHKKRSRGLGAVLGGQAAAVTARPFDSLVPQTSSAVVWSAASPAAGGAPDRSLLLDVLVSHHEARASDLSTVNRLSLYPDEKLLWDPSRVPGNNSGDSSGSVLSLPKLNLQFLTLYDLFHRCFTLYRLESAVGIRADVVEAVSRVGARNVASQDANGFAAASTRFTGWSRMAVPIGAAAAAEGAATTFHGRGGRFGSSSSSDSAASMSPVLRITEVLPPRVGETVPARVSAEVSIDLSRYAPFIRAEWDQLREHDVVFLIAIESVTPQGSTPEDTWQAKLAASAAARALAASVAGGGMTDDSEGQPTLALPPPPPPPRGFPGQQQRSFQTPPEDDPAFPAKQGLVLLRGAEIADILDEKGESISASADEKLKTPAGSRRTLKLLLDPAQYHADLLAAAADPGAAAAAGKGGVAQAGAVSAAVGAAGVEAKYSRFNLLLRRKPEENNFKAVLATVRDVMNQAAQGSSVVVPQWLHDLLLGYGDPAAAHFTRSPAAIADLDFKDTFVSAQHALEVLGSCGVKPVVFQDEATGAVIDPKDAAPPFRVRFESAAGAGKKATQAAIPDGVAVLPTEAVTVIAYKPPPPGPYPEYRPRDNAIPFTPAQILAIRSGMNPGLTLVVGPPGTGKTDVAVQLISNLYHSFPAQRILLIAHSNRALNDLFAKIAGRDIQAHHLLRMGMGGRDVVLTAGGGTEDFTKWGRVAHALQQRAMLLAEVDRLGVSIGVPGDVGYTCETAQYFHLHHIVARIELFRARLRNVPPPPSNEEGSPAAPSASGGSVTVAAAEADVAANRAAARARYQADVARCLAGITAAEVFAAFPFPHYFSTAPGGLAGLFPPGISAAEALASAEACFKHIDNVFAELAAYRAFELLRSQRSRTDYMLTKQARIVAMTCTHASLTRAHLLRLGFTYDTVIMEEAGQVLEVETLVPLLLQSTRPGEAPRLKRVILIGDHHQLPPVVQSRALSRVAHLDQSLFARFIRLGVPAVTLDMQGRARPSLAALYNWRYRRLGNLLAVSMAPAFVTATAGMAYEFQFVDVPDYAGRGESTPLAHFYQNLGEAEYAVALFQYLRLAGHPASSIALLTTYNGQKRLLGDVIRRRCAPYGCFGTPAAVDTVDMFQGQQADIVILSLVRTKAVGHLRDVRRLIVALSRARRGLYVFGRADVFGNCLELRPALRHMLDSAAGRPTRLHLLLGEAHPTHRDVSDRTAAALAGLPVSPVVVEGVDHMGAIVSQIMAAQQMGQVMAAAMAAQQQQQEQQALQQQEGGGEGGEAEAEQVAEGDTASGEGAGTAAATAADAAAVAVQAAAAPPTRKPRARKPLLGEGEDGGDADWASGTGGAAARDYESDEEGDATGGEA